MRKRQLPANAAIALDVFTQHGRRDIPKNELELRLHQRGLNGRDVVKALSAFRRRGWLEQDGHVLVLTQAAFESAPSAQRARPPARRHKYRMPNLFGDR